MDQVHGLLLPQNVIDVSLNMELHPSKLKHQHPGKWAMDQVVFGDKR